MFRSTLVLLSAHSLFASAQNFSFVNTTTSQTASATISGVANATWWGRSYPNYLPLSSDQAGECDTLGALCQTVPVTATIDLTSATKATVIPCSSYLSAQANSLFPRGLYWGPDGIGPPYEGAPQADPHNAAQSSWSLKFGRSPECQETFAQFYYDIYTEYDEISTPFLPRPTALPGCPNNASGSLADPLLYLPPGIDGLNGDLFWQCCGQCELSAPGVRVLYFPDESAPPCNELNSTYSNMTTSRSTLSVTSGASKRADNPVTAVVDGYTFTSPSIYLQVLGTASMIDSCGPVGASYTSPIIAIPSGGLYTISLDVPIGGTFYYDPKYGMEGSTKQVEVTDLACPTWGIGTATVADMTYYGYGRVVGPPFFPLVSPPPELLSFDPSWAKCTAFEKYCEKGCESWAIFDPPSALIPQASVAAFQAPTSQPSSLLPTTTAASPVAESTKATATPVQTPASVATPTKPPADPGSNSVLSTVSKASPSLDPQVSPKSSILSTPRSVQSSADPKQSQGSWMPSLESNSGASSAAEITPSAIVGSAVPASIDSEGVQSAFSEPDPSLGAIIYSAFGGIPITIGVVDSTAQNTIPAADGPSSPSPIFSLFVESPTAPPIGPDVIISGSPALITPIAPQRSEEAGQPLTVTGVSAIAVDSTLLQVGGNPVTISGEIYTLAPSGNVIIGSASGDDPGVVLTIGSETISVKPTALVIDGSTLSASDITVSGTVISLAPSGILVAGTSTINLEDPIPPDAIFTVAGQAVSAGSSLLSVDGTTITAGGPGIAISGTPVSLVPSGYVVVIGTSSYILNPSPVFTIAGQTFTAAAGTPTALSIDGTDIIAGGSGVTISGTPVSLESGGTLIIGTKTIDLNIPTGPVLATVPSGSSVSGLSSMTVTAFVGSQSRVEAWSWMGVIGWIVIGILVVRVI